MEINQLDIKEAENCALKADNSLLKAENAGLRAELAFVKQELAKFKRLIFGQKAEKFIPANIDQLSLDFGIPTVEKPEIQEQSTTITYTKTKIKPKSNQPIPGHSRVILPAHLPRKQEIIEPKPIPEGAKKIGEIITEVLEYEPSSIYVKQFIRIKYALAKNDGIITPELPSLPIPKGNAGPGLLAHVIVNKYVDHLPLYRQSEQLKREGITISDSTLGGWTGSIGKLLDPLYQKHRDIILKSSYLQMDETPIPVLTSDKPGATHKGYLWSNVSPPNNLVLFTYHKSRSAELPDSLLKNFKGALQTDAYSAYEHFEKQVEIILLACMAHARRKFFEAKDNYPLPANKALTYFGQLYDIERHAKISKLSPQERYTLRQQNAVPILNQLKEFLDEQALKQLPKSSIGQAISYSLNIWHRLIRYIDNGLYEIDNNIIENTIRPIALGRKNYLFAGSHEAAQNTALFYSFFGTCKLLDINPQLWLADILSRISDYKANRLEELLPQNWKQ